MVFDAIDWLGTRHRQQLDQLAAQDLFGLADDQLTREVLSSKHSQMLQMAFADWVIAEGAMMVEGVSTRAISLLEQGFTDTLTAGQHRYLKALSVTPLRLYLVESVVPGYSLQLREIGSAASRLVTVRERSGSRPDLQGEAVGARLVAVEDHYELAGGVLSFTSMMMHKLARELRPLVSTVDISRAIRTAWIQQFDPTLQRRPQFVSDEDGEPVQLITDTYQCSNVALFAQRLAAVSRFQGDEVGGWSLEKRRADGRLQMCGIHVDDVGGVTAFYQTASQAERYRPILESVAGDTLRHVTRASEDPFDVAMRLVPRTRSKQPEIPAELMTELFQSGMRQAYADWADKSLPAFEHRSPREMLRTPGGEVRVRELPAMYVRALHIFDRCSG